MKASVTFSGSGIVVERGNRRIALDPSRSTDADVAFVSHAHMDHLHAPANGEKILTSHETSRLATARGYDMKNHTDSFDGLELIDSGHILGSRGLLIDGEVFYTGDISVRDRAFLRGARVPRCKTLILESTYGKPGFVFPSTGEIVDSVNKIISNLYSRGVPAILMGYPLGKAQVLTSLFRHWQPLYLHDSIIEMNNVYQDLGVDLGAGTAYSQAEEDGMLSRKPWIMVAPKTGPRSPFVQQMKDRYGAVTIGFTGWALANWSRFFSDLDYSIPLSDHCDFKELLSIVRACSPSKVYTFHGYAKELASHLTGLGYDAEALVRSNHVLSDYAG